MSSVSNHMSSVSNRLQRCLTRTLPVLTGSAAAVLALSACGSGGAAENADDDALSVVTSTNVYGNLAETVGGKHVEVTSIIDSLSQDPHSYEATVRDKLEVSEADLVIENGGGYDAFLHRLAEDTGVDSDSVINAVELAGLARDDESSGGHAGEEHAGEEHAGEEHGTDGHAGYSHGEFNEHLWYDLSTVSAVAMKTADRLSTLDSGNAETYQENAAEFTASIEELQQHLSAVRDRNGETGVAITEPVPLHLLEAAGLENKTPPEFSQAVEEGNGVPPVVLQETLQLLSDGSVAFLAYNEQTEGTQTQAVKAAAEEADLPVVNFTETLPPDSGYLPWMQENIDNIERALKA